MISKWHRGPTKPGLGRKVTFQEPNDEVIQNLVKAILEGQSTKEACANLYGQGYNTTFYRTVTRHPAIKEAMRVRSVNLNLVGSIYYKQSLERI